MSPYHFCENCEKNIIGNVKYGCMVCLRNNICYNIQFNYYFKYINLCLSNYKIPDDLIIYIINIIITNSKTKLIEINKLCWKSRMHNLIA